MPLFLVTLHRPQGFDHARHLTPAVRRDIDAVNEAMVAAGVRVFVGGLRPAGEARSVRLSPTGDPAVSHGAYLRTDSELDGLWILKVADLATAVHWGQQAARACRGDVEVRPFYG